MATLSILSRTCQKCIIFCQSFLTPQTQGICLFACYYHVTYELQSESTLCSLPEYQGIPWSKQVSIWSLSDSNTIWTHNHLVRKWTLNHLAKLAYSGFESRCWHRVFVFIMSVIYAKCNKTVVSSGYADVCYMINGPLKMVPRHFCYFHCSNDNFNMTFDRKNFVKKLPFLDFQV